MTGEQKERIKLWIQTHKEISIALGGALLILVIGLLQSLCTPEKESPAASTTRESFDTYIPEGFSLVPLEISNYETLDSLLGPYGVVDIFAADPMKPDQPKRIAFRVKILRAPNNPSHFAVLVPFQEVQQILKYPGPFTVSVQNPRSLGTRIEKEKSRKRSRITFNTGD